MHFHSTAAFVSDIEVSKKFYTEVLEQEVELDFEKNVILAGGITLWEIDHNHIIPEELGIESVSNKGANRFEFYFETADIERVYKKLREGGVDFLHGLHEEPWGQRTVRFFVPDRHLIKIGETLGSFVQRLSKRNMTPDQISKKTSIPVETVRELLRG